MRLLITGASRGIGRALCAEAAGQGHEVLALARSEERLEALAGHYERVHPIPLDIGEEGMDADLVRKLEGLGVRSLDGVVHAAALLKKATLDELDREAWERQMKVGLLGPAMLLRALRSYLKEGKDPHVVLIGSMAGYPGSKKFPGMTAYAASKAGLAGFGEVLAEEWKEAGIRVNTLSLGAVDTEMFREAFPDQEAPITPDEMAAFILYFLTDGGKLMNGKNLPVSQSTP